MKVRLEEICEILDSQRIPVTASSREKGKYPYYGANGIQDYISEYIFDDELVLLAEDGGNFGSKEKPIAYRVSGKCWVNNHAHVLKPKAGIDVDYLCYSLMFYDVSSLVNGATRKKLNQSDMRKMEIEVRSITEQEKIVKLLKKLENVIIDRKNQINKLDELVKSRFIEMFGDDYPITTAEKACINIADCPHSTPTYKGIELIYPAIRTTEIKNGNIDWTEMKYVDISEYNERTKRITPQAGDIVYAREGTYGDCVVLPETHKFCLGQRVMLFRPDPQVCTSEYLHYVLKSDNVKQQAKKNNAGSTVPHVNVKDAMKFSFKLPPVNLQNEFVNFVQQVDKSKLAIQKSLDKLEILQKSLMQQYFG